MHEKIPSLSLDSQVALSPPQAQGTVQAALGFQTQVQGTVPSGTKVEIDVSLIDSSGAESSVLVETVTVP